MGPVLKQERYARQPFGFLDPFPPVNFIVRPVRDFSQVIARHMNIHVVQFVCIELHEYDAGEPGREVQ